MPLEEKLKEELKLSKHNNIRTNYSNNKIEMAEEAVEAVEEDVHEEIKIESAKIFGNVFDCTKLNIRSEHSLDGEIICTVPVSTEVEIDSEKSTNDWFYIYTDTGIEGFCMKKYIRVK